MVKPEDLFDRDREWADLLGFTRHDGPGIRLALVRGRRRQGKSYLLRRLAEQTGGLYVQAVQEDRRQALDGFGLALGRHLGVPGGRVALDDWSAALDALQGLPRTAGRAPVVVIDELPYLLAHSPELPSLLQRAIDESRDSGPPLALIVCGSALSVMADLLTGTRALRGRASLDVVVGTFDHRAAARFWGIDDPGAAFEVHAILGGTPGYRDLLPARPPRRRGEVARWLATGVLNPSSAMFREDDYLLTEERTLTDRALYHSVVTAIADGHTTQGGIAAALGRDARAVQHPLRSLEEAGFVTRADDALRSRRPIYAVADPIVRFHHVVTRRDLARFEDRRTDEAWTDALPRYRTHVLGPHFEHIAREWTARFASADTVGGRAVTVRPAVVNDARGRTQHEIDVVALGRADDGSSPVLALGEAKHTTARRTAADLDRLDAIRSVVADRHPSAAGARLLLFSAAGFDRTLTARAEARPDVELVDLTRLYGGDER